MSETIMFNTEGLPILQNRVYNTKEEAVTCARGDVCLVKDRKSKVIFNAAFQPEKIVYDENYQNEQGWSPIFVQHLNEVARIIEQHACGKTILEVGCGKGTFIELLRSRNLNAIGIDPAYEGNAPYVIRRLFSPSLGLTGEVIVLRHVLEHIPQPLKFLKDIATSNRRKGLIYIEVPCLNWIVENRAWYDIFYEHVNYFRLSDFGHFFGNVIDSGKLFGGQYIFIIADLASFRMNFPVDEEKFSIPSDFLSGIDKSINIIQEAKGRHHVIWGASSKGVLFSLYLERWNRLPDFAIDINPAKQEKYLPATGLRVLSPESAFKYLNPGDIIFVMNPNYFNEIRYQGGTNYKYYLP